MRRGKDKKECFDAKEEDERKKNDRMVSDGRGHSKKGGKGNK